MSLIFIFLFLFTPFYDAYVSVNIAQRALHCSGPQPLETLLLASFLIAVPHHVMYYFPCPRPSRSTWVNIVPCLRQRPVLLPQTVVKEGLTISTRKQAEARHDPALLHPSTWDMEPSDTFTRNIMSFVILLSCSRVRTTDMEELIESRCFYCEKVRSPCISKQIAISRIRNQFVLRVSGAV